jgi:phosphatidylinositol dimannoside acyltransferase
LPWLERMLAAALGHLPNRKFASTLAVAEAARLVERSDKKYRRAHVGFVSSYYLRFFALVSGRYRLLAFERVEVRGERYLLAAEAHHVGAILVSAHLGDFDAAGAWLAGSRGITPVVVASPLRPRWREALFSAVRSRCGVKMRSVEATTLGALGEDLRAGRWVLSMIDRRTAGPTLPGTLLDQTAAVPAAMAILSLRTGAPLLPAATWRGANESMTLWFGRPVVPRTRSEAFLALAEAVKQIEQHLRRHPEQWHVPADRHQLAWTGGRLECADGVRHTTVAGGAPEESDQGRSVSADSVSLPARRMSR